MPIYLVDTISSFRLRYAVEAKSLEHAMDEIVMNEANHQFDDLTQKHLGEQIVDGREVTKEEFDKYVVGLKDDMAEMSSHWMGDKMIHKVNYDE